MARMLPLLTHLRPPMDTIEIVLKRFSPLFSNPECFGLKQVRPWPSYSYVFPFPRRQLDGIAYHFDFRYVDGRRPFEYSRPLRRQVGKWIELWQAPGGNRPRLDMHVAGDSVVIADTRPCASRRTHRLCGLAAKIYRQGDAVQSLPTLLRPFDGRAGDSDVRETLRKLVAAKLMIEDDGRYLSLAIRQKPASSRPAASAY